jgi:2-desacetyl-2-hydroxyethyl bacteriochlorophyllide A dehydrogenase
VIPRRLLLVGPRQVELRPLEVRPLRAGEARLQTLYSGISHGTELNHYRGASPFASFRFDGELRVFRSRDDEASAYPMPMGYELVSRVAEVAADVTRLAVGDLVHTDSEHAEETIVDVEQAARSDLYPLVKLPTEFDPTVGVYISLGAVALQAVHDARVKVGDSVAVFGLGTVGLMTVQLARLSGAAWVAGVDPIAERRAVAEQCGAAVTVDPGEQIASAGIAVKEQAPGNVDVAIETSGSYAGLHEAIRSVAVGGRVVTVGFYHGDGSNLRLGEEWHHNRVEMVSSMGVWGCPHRDYPLWGRTRMMQSVVDLLANGGLDVSQFPVRFFPFEQAAAAYALLDSDPAATLKVGLRYER